MMNKMVVDVSRLDGAAKLASCVDLPLVSIIIINYNYGRFLRDAVNSVFEQTYPRIECIIIDNASTDESGDVLIDIAERYQDATILRRQANGGQCIAAIEGFNKSSGEYVVFLDADDILLPAFIETHIFVHLSLRIPVGFSSVDMIQAVDRRMVLGTFFSIGEFVRSGKGKRVDLLHRIDKNAAEIWPLHSVDSTLESQVHYVEPLDATWVWSPTSGNCFRRDALNLFLCNEKLPQLQCALDTYLARGINVLTGSVLIARSLAVYRMHGANIFSKHPQLNGCLAFDRSSPNNKDQLSREFIINHMLSNAKLFLNKVLSPLYFFEALIALDIADPQLQSSIKGCKSYLGSELIYHRQTLAREFGLAPLLALMKRLGVRGLFLS